MQIGPIYRQEISTERTKDWTNLPAGMRPDIFKMWQVDLHLPTPILLFILRPEVCRPNDGDDPHLPSFSPHHIIVAEKRA